MSAEIQFGDLEHNEPQTAVRPDRDGHFCIARIGAPEAGELPIFVDLDVMRDMEAHASSNTKVELGGVMLGKQSLDAQGNPFVTITDSLRADHYEATRGSFKFTHETWSQITQQRNKFKPDLEMVGWYHTHPGWTVFLSPKDLFICNNFFNRKLDVALVIDPCNDDRGWFQWVENITKTISKNADASNTDEEINQTEDNPGNPGNSGMRTRRTGGFYLTTSRYRQDELVYFSRLYNNEPEMNVDPRYSGNPVGGNLQQPVTMMNNRNPLLDFVLAGMLMCQVLFMGWMAWQMNKANTPEQVATTEVDTTQSDLVHEQEIAALKSALTIVSNQQGNAGIGEQIAAMESRSKHLEAGLDGQIARGELLIRERNDAKEELVTALTKQTDLTNDLVSTRNTIAKLDEENKELLAQLELATEGKNLNGYPLSWLIGSCLVTTLLGGLLGYLWGPAKRDDEFDDLDRDNRTRVVESPKDAIATDDEISFGTSTQTSGRS